MAINETLPFTVETDPSNVAISAILNQRGKPVAFFSRTLLAHQGKYPAKKRGFGGGGGFHTLVASFVRAQVYTNNRSTLSGVYV